MADSRRKFCGKSASVLSMLFMTSSFFLVEIIVGYATNSMALVADSFHMLSDIMSLIIGFFALRYSKRSQRTERNTFGWQRAEVLGALVNAVFLIALCFSILVESLKRIVETESINNPILVLIVGAIGLLVNVIGLVLFHRHGHGHSHGGGGHGHSHGTKNGVNGVDRKSSNSGSDEESEMISDTTNAVEGTEGKPKKKNGCKTYTKKGKFKIGDVGYSEIVSFEFTSNEQQLQLKLFFVNIPRSFKHVLLYHKS